MVDDDVALLRVVREALAASLKCEVDTSPKPEYAFELALKKKYDLFIFDFQMPMIDGAMLFFFDRQSLSKHPADQGDPAGYSCFRQSRGKTSARITQG